MNKIRWISLLALIGLFISACVPSPAATVLPATGVPATAGPVETRTPPEAFEPAAVAAARQALASQLNVDPSTVEVQTYDTAEWPDSCLGLPSRDEACAEVITPGYRVVLDVDGERYEFHTDAAGGDVRLAAAPEPQIGAVIVDWEGQDGVCKTLVAGDQGLAYGLCGGPLMSGRFAVEQRSEDLETYLKTYTAFEADTPAGKITFNGQGSRQANPAEQRMVAEWARLAYIEAVDGRGGASDGLALAWHREGGIAGFCDDLEVFLTGRVSAASCKGSQPQEPGGSRLDPSQLERLYAWIDSLKAFEMEQTDPAAADAMTIRLVFAGMGEKEAGDPEKTEIQEFAALLYASLEQREPQSTLQGTLSVDLEEARQALLAYFSALDAGRYAEAAGYYGGSYEILTGYNPDIQPEDHEALLDAGCRYNGLQCLKVREIVSAEQVSPNEFSFTVQFSNPDGSLFQRGPCCSINPSQSPPESQFLFTVVKSDGKYLVQELPVYVP